MRRKGGEKEWKKEGRRKERDTVLYQFSSEEKHWILFLSLSKHSILNLSQV